MSWPGMTYADPADVLELAADPVAPGWHCPTGNGRRVPTRYRVRYRTPGQGIRWRRVYAVRYGRTAGLYVVADGRRVGLNWAALVDVPVRPHLARVAS